MGYAISLLKFIITPCVQNGDKPEDLAKKLGDRQDIAVLLSPEEQEGELPVRELEEELPVRELEEGRESPRGLQRVRSSFVKFFRNFRLRDIKLVSACHITHT